MVARKSLFRSGKGDESRIIGRGLALGGTLILWMACLIARLYYLQIICYTDLTERGQKQQQRVVEVAPDRGTIFDCNSRPLAMSVARESIYAVPAEIPDRDMVADLLAPILGVDAAVLRERFHSRPSFCWVKRKAADDEVARVRDLNLKGVYFQKELKRVYPKGELAAHTLGYVGTDDNGLAGLEHSLNREILGRAGKVVLAADARRQSFLSKGAEGVPGKNVVLTLDESIQYIAEKALAEAVAQWHAAGGVVIVQNPNTGEILAMSSRPTFNPNEYAKSPEEARVDHAIGWVYEPGSTFKIVTVSAALEEKLTTPQEVIDCQMGSIRLANHVIHDHLRFGNLSVDDILVHSSDVGAIKLGLRLGKDRLYRYMTRFGFGEKTGIEAPGEERGLLKPSSLWTGISIGEMSMGQEVAVTPLQLVTAYSAIANGGVLFQPHLVRDVFGDGLHDSLRPAEGHRVVSEQTAAMMKQMFQDVVERGTGQRARVSRYTVGGKTGTAQKIDASGHYSHSHYIASFVGFAPVPHPAVTILVVIDSPVGAIYGGDVSGPVFKSIAEQTLAYLNVPSDNAWTQPLLASTGPRRPAGRGPTATADDDADDLPGEITLVDSTTGSSQPVSLRDAADRETAQLSQGTQVVDEGPLVTVPSFSGQSVRVVAKECQQQGFDLAVLGSGLAVEQSPSAGTQAHAGARIVVRFAR
ncbi:MAG TPA: penicillin-binding transpeptidase domain-containing protein [Terriglobia bacterium]|nr:penicillin-binding transpeptidase domain-containing protein [Terriglobia bacterium]